MALQALNEGLQAIMTLRRDLSPLKGSIRQVLLECQINDDLFRGSIAVGFNNPPENTPKNRAYPHSKPLVYARIADRNVENENLSPL